MTHTPRLWFTPNSLEQLRRRVAAGEPTASAIFNLAKAMADLPLAEALGPVDPATGRHQSKHGNQYAEACAISYMITANPDYARKACAYFLTETKPFHLGNLGIGGWAMCGAILHEACYDALDPDQQIQLTRLLIKLIGGLMEIRTGDPHIVTNNHWAVVHSAAAMAAMAAHLHPITPDGRLADLSHEIAWARQRVRAFVTIHGDQGLYHEGIGYMGYPASYWWPAIAASIGFDGLNLVDQYPALRNQAAAAFSVACARPAISDETAQPSGKWGMKLSWNDDGLGWMSSANVPLMIHFAHPHQQPALRWMYDRLNGVLSPAHEFSPGFNGWFFTLLYYPYDVPPADPEGVLPHHLTDYRQGITVFRNRYHDADDAILGAYAKCQFPGGHWQDDAGSIRFMALGHDWIMGGGQAKADPEWQSIVTPADNKQRASGNRLGAIICDEPHPHGGVLGIELRKASGSYHERLLAADFSALSGSPAVLALLDQVDDHLRDRDWLWNLTFEIGLAFEPHPDNAGFTLRAHDNANLVARFLGIKPDRLACEKMPDSHRYFQSMPEKHIYPGRPFVSALFKNQPHLGIYVVMAVQRGPAPAIQKLSGLDVQIGPWTWTRPFGAAVPKNFLPGVSGGLCRNPSGIPNFTADQLLARHCGS